MDERKRESNIAKHGVDFRRMQRLFDGMVVERVDARRDYGEERIACLGEIDGMLNAVIYTWRGAKRRIISARKANGRGI
jgi:uncharacterized DUF497 family protein